MERIIHGEFWRLNFFFPDTSSLILTHWLHSLPLLYIPEFQFNYCWNRSITLILVRQTLAFYCGFWFRRLVLDNIKPA